METAIVILIIIAAGAYVVWSFYKSQKKDDDSGCGCSSGKGGCTGCGQQSHHPKNK